MTLPFIKMAGCGNDFVIVEGKDVPTNLDIYRLASHICRAGTGIGADGLVVIDRTPVGEAHFSVRIVNRSGLEAEMCGNAARCIARLAVDRGIAGNQHVFRTLAGDVESTVGPESIGVLLPQPSPLKRDVEVPLSDSIHRIDVIDVGVPHAVLWSDDLQSAPVEKLGRLLRHWSGFAAGANINFACMEGGRLRMRTFERGVEAETLACGTGAASCAISAACRGLAQPPIIVITSQGSELLISFELDGNIARNVTLTGPATYICEGTISDEWLTTVA